MPDTIPVDAHCHMDRMKDFSFMKEVLPVTIGYEHKSNLAASEIAEKYKVPFALGIAPQTAVMHGLADLDKWCDFILSKRPNAIGEVGLDFHWAKTEKHKDDETALFSRMLEIAGNMKLPLVIHSRDADKEVMDMIEDAGHRHGFMMHFFSGSVASAERAVAMGGHISVPPLPSKSRADVIKKVPMENLLAETDSPYVARSPLDVRKSIQFIADTKQTDFNVAVENTAMNARTFFRF